MRANVGASCASYALKSVYEATATYLEWPSLTVKVFLAWVHA